MQIASIDNRRRTDGFLLLSLEFVYFHDLNSGNSVEMSLLRIDLSLISLPPSSQTVQRCVLLILYNLLSRTRHLALPPTKDRPEAIVSHHRYRV